MSSPIYRLVPFCCSTQNPDDGSFAANRSHDPWLAPRAAGPGDVIHIASGTHYGRYDRNSWIVDRPNLTDPWRIQPRSSHGARRGRRRPSLPSLPMRSSSGEQPHRRPRRPSRTGARWTLLRRRRAQWIRRKAAGGIRLSQHERTHRVFQCEGSDDQELRLRQQREWRRGACGRGLALRKQPGHQHDRSRFAEPAQSPRWRATDHRPRQFLLSSHTTKVRRVEPAVTRPSESASVVQR